MVRRERFIVLVLKERVTIMAVKKSPSASVQKSVNAAVAVPPVVEAAVAPTRGPKQFTSDQYIAGYKEETKIEGGSWKNLCERTGFKLESVRQTITTERTAIRKAAFERISSAPENIQAKVLKNTKQTDCESYADYVAELELPFLSGDGTRNTAAKKRKDTYQTMSLPGF